jgi:orotate phosphoribosyltransferase
MATSTQPTTSTIPAYKTAFLESCLSANVLTFGTYTLKSGRRTYSLVLASIHTIADLSDTAESPYFFNAGSFHTSPLLSAISTAYAHTIISFLSSHPSIPKPDVLFG